MSNYKKSASVHKHLHYHYHYDMNDLSGIQPHQKYSSNSTLTPKQSHIFQQKNSWKNHINPQITRLYEEISLDQSRQQTFTPKASRFSNPSAIQKDSPYNQNQGISMSRSRLELIKQIQNYQEYLKKRSGTNLYVPNTKSLINLKQQDKNAQSPQRLISLDQIYKTGRKSKEYFENVRMGKTDSKINNQKMDHSTTARQENSLIRQSEIRVDERNKQSEYKNHANTHSSIQDNLKQSFINKAKVRMSQIEQKQNRYQEQNSNFTLFQGDANKQSSKTSIKQIYQPDVPIHSQDYIIKSKFQSKQKLKQNSQAYQLVKQECNFLRTKFIQHIQKIHDIKF